MPTLAGIRRAAPVVLPWLADVALLLGVPLVDAFFPNLPGSVRSGLYALPLIGTLLLLGVLGRRFANLSLRVKFLSVCLVLALIPFLIVSMLSNRALIRELHHQTHAHLNDAARQHGAALDGMLQGILDSVRVEAMLPPLVAYLETPPAGRGGDVERLARGVLNALGRRSTLNISSYALIDGSGVNVLDTFARDGLPDKSRRRYFTEPMSSGLPFVSEIILSPVTHKPSFFFSAPVRGADGHRLGVLRVRYEASVLQQFLLERLRLGGVEPYALLLDEYGIRLADGLNPAATLRPLSALDARSLADLRLGMRVGADADTGTVAALPGVLEYVRTVADTSGFMGRVHPDDPRTMLCEGVVLQSAPWRLILAVPLASALAPVREQALTSTAIALIWAVLAGVAAILASAAVSGPLARLAEFVDRLGRGEFDAQAPVESADESGQLAQALNDMSRNLGRARAQLQDNADRWRGLLDTLPDTVLVLDSQGSIETCNRRFKSMFGLTCQDVREQGWDAISAPGHGLDAVRARLDGAQRMGSLAFEWSGRKADGSSFPARVRLRSLQVPEGARLLAVITDVSESRRAEREAEALRLLLQETVDAMPSVLLGVDDDGRVALWNRQAVLVSGVPKERAVGALLREVWPDMTVVSELVREALTTKNVVSRLKVRQPGPGGQHYADVLVYPLPDGLLTGAVVRVDDVTERVRFEETVLQSEKMISLGGLAAGMAHEINNPLAAMLGNAQILRQRLLEPLPKNVDTAARLGVDFELVSAYARERGMPRMLQMILDSGKRAADIVMNMLSFSRTQVECRGAYSLARLADKCLELAQVEYDLRKGFDFQQIRIMRDYASDVRDVNCDPQKIQQVLINLFRNAADAMADKAYAPPEVPQLELVLRQEGARAVLTIADNGPGLPEEVRGRVFEPFFTTKAVGQGTGLGLSVSYFIITDEHKGALSVDSSPGQWTRFRLELPCSDDHCVLLRELTDESI